MSEINHNNDEKLINSAIYEEISILFNRITESIDKAEQSVKAHYRKKEKNGDIKNLIKHDLFNRSNWNKSKIKEMLEENLGISRYISKIEHPLNGKVEKEQYEKIYCDIIESYIKDEIKLVPYKDDVIDGIIKNYEKNSENNEDMFNDNIKRTERLYTYISEMSQNRIDGIKDNDGTDGVRDDETGSIRNRITSIKSGIAEKVSLKDTEINSQKEAIGAYEQIIREGHAPNVSAIDETTPLMDITIEIVGSLGRFLYILGVPFKGLFKHVGARFSILSNAISKISALPIFWMTLIFSGINGWFLYQTFKSIVSDNSAVLLLTIIYLAILSVLPLITSKHTHEIVTATENRERVVLKIYLIIEGMLIIVASITYPALTIFNRQIYSNNALNVINPFYEYPDLVNLQNEAAIRLDNQSQMIASVAIGLAPLLIATAIGLMNYRRLRNSL